MLRTMIKRELKRPDSAYTPNMSYRQSDAHSPLQLQRLTFAHEALASHELGERGLVADDAARRHDAECPHVLSEPPTLPCARHTRLQQVYICAAGAVYLAQRLCAQWKTSGCGSSTSAATLRAS